MWVKLHKRQLLWSLAVVTVVVFGVVIVSCSSSEDPDGSQTPATRSPSPTKSQPATPDADESTSVVDPESGQLVLVDQLAILAPGEDVTNAIRPYEGVITIGVPETDTYQVRFPVTTLEQLSEIEASIRSQGLSVQKVIVIDQP